MSHDWPGNVRELENTMEQAVALASGPILQEGDVLPNLEYDLRARLPGDSELMTLEELERRAIFLALQQTTGNMQAAARLLGIGKTTLYGNVKQFGLGPATKATSTSNEVVRMESFLICTNSMCRYLVNLLERVQVLERSKLVIDECPECGHPWSSACPFCGRPLEAIRRGNLSRCLHCKESLQPMAT